MYDQLTVARALAALEEAGGDLRAASGATGIPRSTLQAWASGRTPHEAAPRPAPVRPRCDFGTRAEAVVSVLSGAGARETAARLGVCATSVYNWLRKHSEGGWAAVAAGAPGGGTAVGGDGGGARERAYDGFEGTPEERIRRLELENAILREVNEVLKGVRPGEMSNREKSLVIDSLRAKEGIPLRELTASLRISKSSYEYWRRKALHPRPTRRELLADEVERVFAEEGRSARGYRFVHEVLARRRGPVSEKVVRDVMRERGLRPVYLRRRRGYSSYAGEIGDAPANLPLRGDGTHDFSAAAPNERWVTDITEFRLPGDGRKVYLSPVVDLFDSKPAAWSIGLRPDAALANSSLEAACATLAPGERPWCHSDRGCHYRWEGWRRICEEHGVTRSMSRKGHSPDNAACEGFFGRLKNEFFHGRDWRGVAAEEFMRRLDGWMRFYSEGRLKLFVDEDGRKYYDTIDNRRRRLGYAV